MLLELLLKQQRKSLDKIVATSRRKGARWPDIAADVEELTGVKVSYETLRQWYPEHRDRVA